MYFGKDRIHCVERTGAGYYRVQVRSLYEDITVRLSSEWSELSEPYYYDGSEIVPPKPVTVISQSWIGDNDHFYWRYMSDDTLYLGGEVPQGHTLIAVGLDASYRFLGAKVLTAQDMAEYNATVQMPTGTTFLKIFWLDENLVPQCLNESTRLY